MNWLWPETEQAHTSILIRLARVIHWLSLAIAAAAFVGMLSDGRDVLESGAAFMAIMISGRGIRYILANE